MRVEVEAELAELLPAFLKELEAFAAALPEALERRDLAAMRRIGHQLKGVGLPYGFAYVSELGLAIEQATKAEDWQALAGLAPALGQHLAEVEVVLQ